MEVLFTVFPQSGANPTLAAAVPPQVKLTKQKSDYTQNYHPETYHSLQKTIHDNENACSIIHPILTRQSNRCQRVLVRIQRLEVEQEVQIYHLRVEPRENADCRGQDVVGRRLRVIFA